jgi:hypothetical protein
MSVIFPAPAPYDPKVFNSLPSIEDSYDNFKSNNGFKVVEEKLANLVGVGSYTLGSH